VSDNASSWNSLSPRYRVEMMLGTALVFVPPLAMVGIPLWVGEQDFIPWSWVAIALLALVGLFAVGFVPRRVRAMQYSLRSDDLVFRKGIFFQRSVAVPYGRLQLVDVSRGPISRLLGLSKLSLVTASASSGVSIPGLPQDVAEKLRDHLIAVAETRRAGL
jgi:membrane protein YdbS with pleckstrin-like domain